MGFNIADAHVGALLVAGSIPDALEVADWVRGQAADLPGAALAPELPAGPRSAPVVLDDARAVGTCVDRTDGSRVRRRLGFLLPGPECDGPGDQRFDRPGRCARRTRPRSADVPFP